MTPGIMFTKKRTTHVCIMIVLFFENTEGLEKNLQNYTRRWDEEGRGWVEQSSEGALICFEGHERARVQLFPRKLNLRRIAHTFLRQKSTGEQYVRLFRR